LFFLGWAIAAGPQVVTAQRPMGIDVSTYQGTALDWPAIKASGITFAWSKATEGNGASDNTFLVNQTNAKAAGVLIGAYHYARYDLNTGTAGATAEANWFWSVTKNYIKSSGAYLMPMLDVEASPSGYTQAALAQWINQWCNTVSNSAYAAGVTIKPVIYVSACHANYFDSSVAQWIPWIANYNGQNPQTSNPWTACSGLDIWGPGVWDLWQYSSTTSVPNHAGNVDGDVFNGTATDLTNTLAITGDGAAVVNSSVPGGVLPGQTFTATITMNNEGTTAWTNNGANPYKLGSQSPQDNFTWGTNRVMLPSSPINPGQNATFSITATAPSTPGTYTFAWKMVKEGVHWFGATFTTTINVGNSASIVSSSVPSTLTIGQAFTATITLKNNGGTVWTNTGAIPYKLGSQSPQDNTIWGTNRVALPSSPISPGQNATFTFSAIAPATIGTYTFAWKMLQEPGAFFGATFTTNIAVILSGPGTTLGSYTIDTNLDSTSRNGSYVQYTTCTDKIGWYSFGVPGTSNCTVFNRDIRWMPAFPTYGFTGRGYLTATALVPDMHATATVKFFAVNAVGADLAGPITGSINECAFSCSSPTFYNSTVNVTSFGGFRSNTQDDSIPGVGGCNAACGTFPAGYSQMHIQAARWQYIDDWTCLGGYASASVSDTSNRSFNEAGLYLYPAVDASHGNVIAATMGLNGQTPGRVTTGDCNNANTLDFKANANAFGGGDNMDSYGFAWIFSPAGGSNKLAIGSANGNRVWVNGSLKNDTNATRSLTRDQDVTATVSLPAGWSRVLFKVHNFTGAFQGTVSLRNGTNVNLNNPSLNCYDLGGYYSYGLGYEQDAWYPQIVVSNVYDVSSPVNGTAFYGNNTTVAASGAANGQGPVPYWRTMQYEWGNDLGDADSDYADVSGTPTSSSWSHTTTDVTGHRRFHFFAVSQSGRTSFQNSGIIGGSRFQDAGNYARYYDVYVDNLPPQSPSFSSVVAAGTTQINLAWNIPLDQGVNVTPGSSESAGGAGNQEAQNWYRVGDVAVQAYRNGSLLSSWGTSTAITDTGLTPNSAYTYTLEARDNHTGARGAWNNSTGPQATNTGWTLSVPPTAASITPSQTNTVTGSNITWTAVGGFGAGLVQYYRYAWDQSATHTFTDTETQWSGGAIATVANSAGTWYLHAKGFNGADVGNGTYDYPITVTVPQTDAPQILSIGSVGNIVTLAWSSVSGATYRVEFTPDLGSTAWTNLVPDVPATNSITSTTDDTGGAIQRFYRVILLP
jgi:GH25 family lysozyme M1 (1,4-beta-N-acetylmuramidase)